MKEVADAPGTAQQEGKRMLRKAQGKGLTGEAGTAINAGQEEGKEEKTGKKGARKMTRGEEERNKTWKEEQKESVLDFDRFAIPKRRAFGESWPGMGLGLDWLGVGCLRAFVDPPVTDVRAAIVVQRACLLCVEARDARWR